MIRATPPSNQPGERPRIKVLSIQIPDHTERKGFLSEHAKCHSYCGRLPGPHVNEQKCWVCTSHPSEIYFCCQLDLKRKKKKKKNKKKKKSKITPNDYRGNGNVPVFVAANTILIKPKLLLRSLSNKYFSIILIFS